MDFAIDAGLAHTPGDQLRDLRAEVDDEDEVMAMPPHVAEEAGKRNPASRKPGSRATAAFKGRQPPPSAASTFHRERPP